MRELEQLLAAFERDLVKALHHQCEPDSRPARITLTVQ